MVQNSILQYVVDKIDDYTESMKNPMNLVDIKSQCNGKEKSHVCVI